jgi:hypothetical protein
MKKLLMAIAATMALAAPSFAQGVYLLGDSGQGNEAKAVTTTGGASVSGGLGSLTLGSKRFVGLTSEASAFTAVAFNAYLATATLIATLPDAVAAGVGAEVYIKNTGSGTVTMASTSSQTISGGAAGSTTIATTTSKTFISDGTNWQAE